MREYMPSRRANTMDKMISLKVQRILRDFMAVLDIMAKQGFQTQ